MKPSAANRFDEAARLLAKAEPHEPLPEWLVPILTHFSPVRMS
jgi:hypothetical protein